MGKASTGLGPSREASFRCRRQKRNIKPSPITERPLLASINCVIRVTLQNGENMTENKTPSLVERLEAWLFKKTRKDTAVIFHDEIAVATKLKAAVANEKCPACDNPLELRKFERGPQGWELEVICPKCNFNAVLNPGWTLLQEIDSIGRAREK